MNISQINTDITEGKWLLAAMAILTTQTNIFLSERDVNGTKMTPDEMFNEIDKLKHKMYD